jgi:glucose uptake protein
VALFSLVLLFTAGSAGSRGMAAIANLRQAQSGPVAHALVSGALFNLSNILLVVAIARVGMAVAFPVGVGLALVIGTVASYVQSPRGNPLLLGAGVLLVLAAMLLSATAYSRLPRAKDQGWSKGVIFAVVAGCLMGFFYPQLSSAISPGFRSGEIDPGMLTPYSALALFGLGLLVSNLLINSVFLRVSHLTYRDYFQGTARLHSLGILGGAIWMLALSLNILASGVAGPAISYALGQGATLVAAIWGVLIWREFRGAPAGTGRLLGLTFAAYAAGLLLIGVATL